MAIKAVHNEVEFGVGDKIKVSQKIKEGEKTRTSTFEGMVIAIKGQTGRKMFTVRRIGEAGVGIEKIFPLDLPTIESIKIVKKGQFGIKRAKLYYIRGKSPKEIERIYSRSKVIMASKEKASKKKKV